MQAFYTCFLKFCLALNSYYILINFSTQTTSLHKLRFYVKRLSCFFFPVNPHLIQNKKRQATPNPLLIASRNGSRGLV
mgnify:CR=1 FL=1